MTAVAGAQTSHLAEFQAESTTSCTKSPMLNSYSKASTQPASDHTHEISSRQLVIARLLPVALLRPLWLNAYLIFVIIPQICDCGTAVRVDGGALNFCSVWP